MSDKPKRIQRKRTKGWKLPKGAVCVTRPGKWGNPFTIDRCRETCLSSRTPVAFVRFFVADSFRGWLSPHWRLLWDSEESEQRRQYILDHIGELRGKDLACWCPLDQPCHADVLLELANEVKCDGCGQSIDPDTCHCGDLMDLHTASSDHIPVPMGCDCYRVSVKGNLDIPEQFPKTQQLEGGAQ